MSKRQSDVADVLLAAGAAWLALRGHDPAAIAARAERAADGIRLMRDRLEQLGEQHIRNVVGCKAPDRCACLYCVERKRSEKRPS